MTMSFFFNDNKTKVHHEAFPENFRMLIVGQSGSGKTTLLMQLLLIPNLLNYDKLYVFARSLHQPKYQCLIEGFRNKLHKLDILNMLNAGHLIRKKQSSIEELALGLRLDNDENGIEPSTIEGEFYSSPGDIPDPSELDKAVKNLMVFDDIMTDKSKQLQRIITLEVEAVTAIQYICRKIIHIYLFIQLGRMLISWYSLNLRLLLLINYSETLLPLTCHLVNLKRYVKNIGHLNYLVIDLSRDYNDVATAKGFKYRNNLHI